MHRVNGEWGPAQPPSQARNLGGKRRSQAGRKSGWAASDPFLLLVPTLLHSAVGKLKPVMLFMLNWVL